MKAIMVMYDSLNRHMLPPYGCDWTHAPNFQRLSERALTFDRSYVCSMPCMPARRELHTARPNFLHRSWGPLEPFDDSVPRMLKENGIGSHLVSDHQHYWETGGATYPQPRSRSWGGQHQFETQLFDVESDPKQENPLDDRDAEQRMIGLMKRLMEECESPAEQFERLGL